MTHCCTSVILNNVKLQYENKEAIHCLNKVSVEKEIDILCSCESIYVGLCLFHELCRLQICLDTSLHVVYLSFSYFEFEN